MDLLIFYLIFLGRERLHSLWTDRFARPRARSRAAVLHPNMIKITEKLKTHLTDLSHGGTQGPVKI